MNITCYIATSADGYIADSEGGVAWLEAVETSYSQSTVPTSSDEDYGYAQFLSKTDALMMGRNTYDQIRGFGEWPYGDKPTCVFTNRPADVDPPVSVKFISRDVVASVHDCAARYGDNIWLVGGANLLASFRAHGLVDRYIITVLPILLGDGVPLFVRGHPPAKERLRLSSCYSYRSGFIQVCYEPMQ